MPAAPMNSRGACGTTDPIWALDWTLDQTNDEGLTRTLVIRIAPPVFSGQPFPAWRSALVLEGPWPPEMPIFGATAVQALALATSMAVSLLSDVAAHGELTDRATGAPVTVEVLQATWGDRGAGGT